MVEGIERVERGRDEQAVRRFVERMAMTLADWGYPRMPARVLVSMMSADDDSLSAADLAERLGVSAAAISGAVRYLLQIGTIEKDPVPGSRRDRYRLPEDPWYQTTMVRGGVIRMLAGMADDGVAAIGSRPSPSGARLAEMRDFCRFVDGELPGLLKKWEATRAASNRERTRAPG